MLEALREIPREPLVYEAGGIIFASALLGFSHVMRQLLRAIGRGRIWILPLLGALLVLVAVVLHGYAWYILMPTAAGGEIPGMLMEVYRYRFIALIAMLLASILTLAGAMGFWFMFNGWRQKGQ